VPGWTAIWAFLIGLQGIMPVVIVYLTKLTIDSFVYARNNHDDVASFDRSVILFVLTGVAFLLADFFSQVGDWVKTAQAEYFSDHLNNVVHAKSGDVDLEFYATPEYQDLMERAQGESQSKPLSVLGNFGAIVQSFITLVLFAALLVSYGWEVPILLVVGTIPGLYLTLKYNRIYHKWWETTAADRNAFQCHRGCGDAYL
jgi:ATP-binding cassette subfamily B protein